MISFTEDECHRLMLKMQEYMDESDVYQSSVGTHMMVGHVPLTSKQAVKLFNDLLLFLADGEEMFKVVDPNES